MVDISFDSVTMETLKRMIGRTFEKYSCDPFVFSPNAFGIVGFRIEGRSYKMTSGLEAVKRFFHTDDNAVMRLAECEPYEISSMMDDGKLIDNSVGDTISSIEVVNDLETVTHSGDQRTLCSTKGVIFHLAGGNEISFEIGTWFSEMITIRRGYDLVKEFTSTKDFLEDWEDCEGYTPECSREIILLKV